MPSSETNTALSEAKQKALSEVRMLDSYAGRAYESDVIYALIKIEEARVLGATPQEILAALREAQRSRGGY